MTLSELRRWRDRLRDSLIEALLGEFPEGDRAAARYRVTLNVRLAFEAYEGQIENFLGRGLDGLPLPDRD